MLSKSRDSIKRKIFFIAKKNGSPVRKVGIYRLKSSLSRKYCVYSHFNEKIIFE